MKAWPRADLILVLVPLLLAVGLAGHRVYEYLWFERAADKVMMNVTSVAEAVSRFHQNTGRWFPSGADSSMRVYSDPFHEGVSDYQGLDQQLLSRENNFGIVLQLVRFNPDLDRAIPVHVFDEPHETGDPYLRVLLDYGDASRTQTEIMIRVQDRLPPKTLAEIDDHYYVIDLRDLIHGS